jgi:hypothetical protein
LVERDIVRRGFEVWRFNDDFRVAAEDYAEAIRAIESLHQAAQSVGLTVSDYKTRTRFTWKYAFEYADVGIDEAMAEVDRGDVEMVVTDYSDADSEFTQSNAEALINSLIMPDSTDLADDEVDDDDERIRLGSLTSRDLRELRRALNTLARGRSPVGLDKAVALFTYAPPLTPRISYYLTRLYEVAPERVTDVISEIIGEHSHSMSEWQALWIVHTLRVTAIDSSNRELVAWLNTQRERGQLRLLGAEAWLALAEIGHASFSELDRALRDEPEVFHQWYLSGLSALRGTPQGPNPKELKAVRDISDFHKAMVPE